MVHNAGILVNTSFKSYSVGRSTARDYCAIPIWTTTLHYCAGLRSRTRLAAGNRSMTVLLRGAGLYSRHRSFMGLVEISVLALNNYWGHSRARSRLDCLLGKFVDCVY